MIINNIISLRNFIKNNNSFSDFNNVNFLLNLTNKQINTYSLQKGGNIILNNNQNPDIIVNDSLPVQDDNPLNNLTNNNQIIQPTNLQQIDFQQNIPQNNQEIVQENINIPENNQEIVQENIIEEQVQNPTILENPKFGVSKVETYTIPKGTILYMGSMDDKGIDNDQEIILGKTTLHGFFSPYIKLASDYIEGCSVNKQNGYIHAYEVIEDITNIFIKKTYKIDDIKNLHDKFCDGKSLYNGIGFFYPKNTIESFFNDNLDNVNYYSEFILCNPNKYLNKLHMQHCIAIRKLSKPYK